MAWCITLADALRLVPVFESGWLNPPQYLPLWAADLRRIAALMAYSAFISRTHLENLHLDRVIEFEEELKNLTTSNS